MQIDTEILSMNMSARMKHLGNISAAELSRIISAQGGHVDQSSISRLKKGDDTSNPTFSRLNDLARGLDVPLWQLLHPAGFDENGKSKVALTPEVDLFILRQSINDACLTLEEMQIELTDLDALADTIAIYYKGQVSGDYKGVAIEMVTLARSLLRKNA